MRYLLLVLPLIAVGCAENYDAQGRAYGGPGGGYYGQYPTPGYSRDYGRYQLYSPGYAFNSGYAYNDRYAGEPYYGGENCGTPYEPKACPPLPRRPLDYYPGDWW